MKLFAEWLKASAGEQVTMLSTNGDQFEPDPALATEGSSMLNSFSMLQPCAFCLVTHTPVNLWCALSMGMPAESPFPEMSSGCGLSKCDNGFCAATCVHMKKNSNHVFEHAFCYTAVSLGSMTR